MSPGEDVALWSDTPHIRKGGDWRPEELRTAEHPLGRVAVVGECLATDGELQTAAQRALETQNPAALASLPGSYTSIVLDGQGTHFVGDAASQYPLYLRPGVGGITFATHTKPFRSGPNAAPPDRLSLAVGVGMPWVYELQAGRTPVEGVVKTLPQEVIHVAPRGHVTTTRHDSMVPERPLTVEEASECLREAMLLGARRRVGLGRRLSADYSGGHDSTSAAYFLAHELDEPLAAITLQAPGMMLDDLEHAQRYLALPASTGKFEHHIFEWHGSKVMYRNLDRIQAGDIPDISVRDRGRYEDYFAFLRTLGSEMHITGNGADGLVDMPPGQYLGQVARLSTLPYFIRAVFQVARAEKDSPKHVLADSLRSPRLDPKSRLLQLAHILQTPGTYDSTLITSIFGAGTAPNWLTRTARKEVADYAAEVAGRSGIPTGMDPANHRTYGELLTLGASQHGMRQTASRYGLRLSAVYYDTDVLKACLGLPAHKRMSPWVFKQLMGLAFTGIVPPEVTSRKTKGDYTKHAYEGLRKSQDFLRAILQDSRLADLGIIDPAVVTRSLENGFLGADMPRPSFDMLIASELWLRALDNESWDERARYVALPAPDVPPAATAKTVPINKRTTYGMSKGAIAVTRENGGAVVVNMQASEYQRIKPFALRILQALHDGESVSAAYDRLAGIYEDVPRDVLEDKAEACIRDLIRTGILSEGSSEYALLEGNMHQVVVPPAQMIPEADHTLDVRLRDYAAALGGLTLGHLLKRKSFGQQVKLLDAIRAKLAKRPSTPEEATKLLAAAHRLSRAHLGKVACVELSMATVLASALRRRQASMVLAVRSDPDSFHAWPQVGDTPIRTEADELIAGVYQPLLKL